MGLGLIHHFLLQKIIVPSHNMTLAIHSVGVFDVMILSPVDIMFKVMRFLSRLSTKRIAYHKEAI